MTIEDVPPTFTIDKTANPTQIDEPGGDIFFAVTIVNTSDEDIRLTSLVDDPFGDLDGVGSCSVPQTIMPGDDYKCSAVIPVSGDPPDIVSDVITATVEDDEGTVVEGFDDAEVEIIEVPPDFRVYKSASPNSVPLLGGEVTFTVRVENRSDFEDLDVTSIMDVPYGDVTQVGGGV